LVTSLDCRGLACPAPVLQTKERVEQAQPKTVKVRLDNEAAMENISRFLKTQGYSIAVSHEGGEYLVIGNRNEGIAGEGEKEQTVEGEEQKVMVMVSSDQMGRGDDELGCKLMINFLKTLKEMGSDLWRLVFVNNGVKLTIGGSEALQDLKDLEDQGIHILVCGTCLSHFNLLEKKDVGQTTNMLDIVTAMQLADKVVNV